MKKVDRSHHQGHVPQSSKKTSVPEKVLGVSKSTVAVAKVGIHPPGSVKGLSHHKVSMKLPHKDTVSKTKHVFSKVI